MLVGRMSIRCEVDSVYGTMSACMPSFLRSVPAGNSSLKEAPYSGCTRSPGHSLSCQELKRQVLLPLGATWRPGSRRPRLYREAPLVCGKAPGALSKNAQWLSIVTAKLGQMRAAACLWHFRRLSELDRMNEAQAQFDTSMSVIISIPRKGRSAVVVRYRTVTLFMLCVTVSSCCLAVSR